MIFYYICLCFRQSGQTETRNAADDEDSFTKQQFDIIQQIMHHTQQQIASSSSTTAAAAAAKTPNPKNPSNAKNWNGQQVRTFRLYKVVVAKNTHGKKNNNKHKFNGSIRDNKSQRHSRNLVKSV